MDTNQKSEQAPNYQIRLRGHFDSSWAHWFDGMVITCQEDGTSLLTGFIPDQPALFGLILNIRDLGVILLSINRI